MKLIKHAIFLLLAFVVCASAKPSNGSIKFGINTLHLAHSAGEFETKSAYFAPYYFGEHIFESGISLNVGLSIGASVGSRNGKYSLNGAQNLGSAPGIGSANLYTDLSYAIGYYLIERELDRPLYIGIGYRNASFGNIAVDHPADALLSYTTMPIEVRGDIALSNRVSMEYGITYEPLLLANASIGGAGFDETKEVAINGSGYGLSMSVGLRYFVSQKWYFYANILAQIQKLGESERVSLANNATISGNSLATPGATSIVSYPASRTSFIGVRFGMGY